MIATYSLAGVFLGSIRTGRPEILLQAYQNTTSPQPGSFPQVPQAIAKLIAKYNKSGSHTVAYKNCYTAPPSLTTALISALGATTERFATPVDFNPKMKYYPIPRRCKVWCSPRCIFFHMAGQLRLSPRTLKCSDAEDPLLPQSGGLLAAADSRGLLPR